MSAEDDIHRDRHISGLSQVPSDKAPATFATSGVLFGMISLGGSPFKAFEVWILRDPAASKMLAADRTNAVLLEEDTRVNQVVGEGKPATVKPGTNYAYAAVVTSYSPPDILFGAGASGLSGTNITPSATKSFAVVTTACGMSSDIALNYVVFNESQAHFLGYRNPSRQVLPADMINKFMHAVETRKLTEIEASDLKHVMRLCHLGAQLFETEIEKNAEYCKVLDAFLKNVLDKPGSKRMLPSSSSTLVKPVSVGGQTSTDSTVVHVTTVKGATQAVIPVYIGEHQRYNGKSSDPTVQLLYYYRGLISKVSLIDTSLYPCVGLTVVDNLVKAGILYVLPPDKRGVRFIAYSRVCTYELDYFSDSSPDFEKIAAFFTAMRDLIFNLRASYEAFVSSAARTTPTHSLTVSDALSGKLHVDSRPLYYSKLLFSGVVTARLGTIPDGVKQVLVKYVHFYGQKAHEAAATLRIAPALYAVENIAAGMKLVVMEMLVGYTPLCQIDDTHVRQAAVVAVMEALTALHAAGFVHGDLHAANVLVKDGSGGTEIRLVDFDWAGQHDVDTYPVVPNSSLEWHKDVAHGKKLSAAHDEYACAALERYAKDPEGEKKKQTVTPPKEDTTVDYTPASEPLRKRKT